MVRLIEKAASILVVDDLPENTALLSTFLTSRGYKVRAVPSGVDALRAVDAEAPDVILLDLVMPEMDGFQVCQTLKLDPKTRHIPIIVVSGLQEREANVRAIEAGADDFLVKPFDSVLLEARIRSSIKTKMLHDQIFEYQDQLENQNEWLEEAVKERTTQIVRTQQVTVFSLAKLAESRDTETGDHLERMRCYAREVASEIITLPQYRNVYDEVFVEQIYESSPLHDIGKVGIPDQILLKPGKLTDEEFRIMQHHTVIGGDTLRAADKEAGENSFLAMGRDIAYSHHERWDGTGYPFGLKGDQIPLASRVVAVSDVYDALSSRRPYKEPFSHDKSVAIILEGKGSHFDPDVVEAFMNREEQIIQIRETFTSNGKLSPLQDIGGAFERLNVGVAK